MRCCRRPPCALTSKHSAGCGCRGPGRGRGAWRPARAGGRACRGRPPANTRCYFRYFTLLLYCTIVSYKLPHLVLPEHDVLVLDWADLAAGVGPDLGRAHVQGHDEEPQRHLYQR